MSGIIEIEDLYYSYRDGTEALRGLSLYVDENERVALLGPNGAGKSTLLLHLNGINLPGQGVVRVLGKEINSKTEKWVRTKVGLVFQDPDDQVFSYTVHEDVAFGPRNMGLSPPEVEERVEQALEAVGMSNYAGHPPYHLSYGQKKRVAIAGVLAMGPPVIVLDEPMAYLDPRGKETLLEILNRLHKSGATIIIATHDVDFAAEWADRVVIIKDGRTLRQGDTSLLTDEEVVSEAHLRFPVVTQIFKRLGDSNTENLPLTVSGAVEAIRRLLSGGGCNNGN
ncbi:MAG: cobalt ABC transporter ATPase [Peptococcaceae bacterium BRH_c4b]|nr:MAG: cobalt ABC transporter ATPase [Peptococcaceae bacterium BRH_c4b]